VSSVKTRCKQCGANVKPECKGCQYNYAAINQAYIEKERKRNKTGGFLGNMSDSAKRGWVNIYYPINENDGTDY